MKYQRLIFRSQDRASGSSYGEPVFNNIRLPSNFFGNTVGGEVKVVLESFCGYGQGTDSNTNPLHFIKVGIKNGFFINENQTLSNGNFAGSQILAYCEGTDRQSTYVFYNFLNNYQGFEDNALILPASFFNSNVSFFLKYINDNVINEPTVESDAYDYYVITLGIYINDEKYKNPPDLKINVEK